MSILTDPDPRTGKMKEVVAARVNRFMFSSSTGLTQLLVNCKLGSQPTIVTTDWGVLQLWRIIWEELVLSLLGIRCNIMLLCLYFELD